MTVKKLRRILDKLPEDTLVCKTDGEYGCANLDVVRYCPQYGLLYLEPYWSRSTTSNIDMNPSFHMSDGSRLDKFALGVIRYYTELGKRIVDGKQDGKSHRIQIIISKCPGDAKRAAQRRRERLTLVVDGTREAGGRLGVGCQSVVCDFNWESLLKREAEK